MDYRFRDLVYQAEQWKDLCSMLDSCWEDLAVLLDVPPQEINSFRESKLYNPKFSPSTQLLEQWQRNSEATVQNLLGILKKINNWDAQLLLHTWIQERLPLSHPLRRSLHASECVTDDNNNQDIKDWLKILSLESLETKLRNLGVETVDDLKILIAEISNRPVPSNLSNENITGVPGEKEYQEAIELGCNYTIALPLLDKSAQLGYPPAFVLLHWLYTSEHFLVGPRNEQKAVEYAQRAAASKKWFIEQAQSGNPVSQYHLAGFYFAVGNVEAAAPWFQQSANQGYVAAQHMLGRCYFSGFGVAQDYHNATHWFQKAADQGYAPAQRDLASCYSTGHGVDKSYQKAIFWYKKSAAQGFTLAQWELAQCSMDHNDYSEVSSWMEGLRAAAGLGYAPAQFLLGRCLEAIEMHTEAAMFYKKAMEQNLPQAQDAYERLLKLRK